MKKIYFCKALFYIKKKVKANKTWVKIVSAGQNIWEKKGLDLKHFYRWKY